MWKESKHFERLVAALHRIEKHGAKVTWNDSIDGRQFDVSIRFRLHNLYEYLTVLECKNWKTPIPVKEVEAFLAKAESVGANKAVVVSSSGFQSGAEKIAKKTPFIELFTLRAAQKLPANMLTNLFMPVRSIYDVCIETSSSEKIALPPRSNELTFYLKQIRIRMKETVRFLEAIVKDRMGTSQSTSEPQTEKIAFPPGTVMIWPYPKRECGVSSLQFRHRVVTARLINTGGIDPGILPRSYEYKNVTTGQSSVFHHGNIETGFETIFKKGKYYLDPATGFSYLCEEIDDDTATVFLVESYQHGDAIAARMKMDPKSSSIYVEIEDQKEIERLKTIYESITAVEHRDRRE